MRPRFLFVVSNYPPLARGGMERGCERLARALARRQVAVTVLTRKTPDCPAAKVDSDGVRVLRVLKPLAIGPLWGITYMAQLSKWLKKLERDWDFVLCFQLYLHSVVANEAARRFGKHSASRLANAGPKGDIAILRAHKNGENVIRAALQAHAFFALSNDTARDLVEAGAPADRIWRLRNFVDTETYTPAGMTSERRELLVMGRFHPNKNMPLVIRAFDRIATGFPDALLRIVGEGSHEQAIRAAADSAANTRSIRIEPWTEHPQNVMKHAWALVSASDSEGLSNTMIEAMACGAPVIATDVSGVRDALDPDGRTPSPIPEGEFSETDYGTIVPVNDEQALAGAMREILADGACRARKAASARRRAVEEYAENAVVETFLLHAETVMRGKTLSERERGFDPSLFAERVS